MRLIICILSPGKIQPINFQQTLRIILIPSTNISCEEEDSMKENHIKRMAGQRLMAGFNGLFLNERLKYLISDLNIGGFILFARNIDAPDQLKKLCNSIKDYARICKLPVPFIAVDQEGGVVSRLKSPFTQFPDGQPGLKTLKQAEEFASITANELYNTGFNMDMAPVLDLQPREFIGIMDKRVFKGDKDFVGEMGAAVIKGLQQRGIVAVGKHFPGIGRTIADSHYELPTLDTTQNDLWDLDMKPFRKAIEQGVGGIMLSHILYSEIDPRWPASLSEIITPEFLRKKMGYNGIVMTDDLDMKAVKHEITVSVERVLNSDIDIALICHESPDIDLAHSQIASLISESALLYDQCSNSLNRIEKVKQDIGF
jgi:beta-N-acetylhexosaminidase